MSGTWPTDYTAPVTWNTCPVWGSLVSYSCVSISLDPLVGQSENGHHIDISAMLRHYSHHLKTWQPPSRIARHRRCRWHFLATGGRPSLAELARFMFHRSWQASSSQCACRETTVKRLVVKNMVPPRRWMARASALYLPSRPFCPSRPSARASSWRPRHTHTNVNGFALLLTMQRAVAADLQQRDLQPLLLPIRRLRTPRYQIARGARARGGAP